jgi:hypothetical protein
MDFKSPTHAIRVDGTKVSLSPNDRIPNRDFVLRYRLAEPRAAGDDKGRRAAATSR